MISTKDFEKLWFLYQTEGVPKGLSINTFCENNGINYETFNTWFKKTHRAVCKVEVTGGPSERPTEKGHQPDGKDFRSHGGILVSIRTREDLIIRKGGLSYQELRELVEKLEVLC